MHDSSDNRDWNEYLEISERNRGAAASIEIVRNATQTKGRASGSVRKSSDDIDEECNTVQIGIGRCIWRGVADPTSAHHGEPPGNLDYSRL